MFNYWKCVLYECTEGTCLDISCDLCKPELYLLCDWGAIFDMNAIGLLFSKFLDMCTSNIAYINDFLLLGISMKKTFYTKWIRPFKMKQLLPFGWRNRNFGVLSVWMKRNFKFFSETSFRFKKIGLQDETDFIVKIHTCL